jgi:hypothetical protein
MRGVLFTREESEGKRLRNPQDTITEGVGLNRLTSNFLEAKIDKAYKVSDQEAVAMVSIVSGLHAPWRRQWCNNAALGFSWSCWHNSFLSESRLTSCMQRGSFWWSCRHNPC